MNSGEDSRHPNLSGEWQRRKANLLLNYLDTQQTTAPRIGEIYLSCNTPSRAEPGIIDLAHLTISKLTQVTGYTLSFKEGDDMPNYRKTRRPSKYRFLLPMYWPAVALTLLIALNAAESALCGLAVFAAPNAPCSIVLPSWLYIGFAAITLCGSFISIYRYYRDFHCGDYYIDHPDF